MLSGNVEGLPLEIELSNRLPSVVHPVYSTVTVLSLFGRSVPVPGFKILKARPDLVFSVSAGTTATSTGVSGGALKETSSISKTSIPAGRPACPL